MAESTREVWITGIGVVSCLGEGPDAHWQKVDGGSSNRRHDNFCSFVVHPLAAINFDAQIPKKAISARWKTGSVSEPMRLDLALDSAGAKGKTDLCPEWT